MLPPGPPGPPPPGPPGPPPPPGPVLSGLLLLGLLLLYSSFLLLGALLFSWLELPVEERQQEELLLLRQAFLNRSCSSSEELDRFLRVLLDHRGTGTKTRTGTGTGTSWDLSSALFYCSTLVTTVGYGHPAPLSDWGKLLSLLYALVGVPFTMLVLSACVQRLMAPLVIGPLRALRRWGLKPRPSTVVHFLLLLLAALLLFLLLPAGVFSVLEAESWSFLDALYFCFISLATIGLGDFVPARQPGQKLRPLYQLCVVVYLFLGLMMMLLLLRSFHLLSDQHGFTSFLQLPRCQDSAPEDPEAEPIMEEEEPIGDGERRPSCAPVKSDSDPLKSQNQISYNAINKS